MFAHKLSVKRDISCGLCKQKSIINASIDCSYSKSLYSKPFDVNIECSYVYAESSFGFFGHFEMSFYAFYITVASTTMIQNTNSREKASYKKDVDSKVTNYSI
jgi:hypothetical protein